jgi:hypothetical protein
MKINLLQLMMTISVIVIPNVLSAQSIKPYTLFNPIPKQQMRNMETDRPDVTESPFTLDAGHIQFETDIFRLQTEKGDLSDQRTQYFNQGNIKIGLLRSTSIQFGFQTYVSQKERDLQTNQISKSQGFGDVTIRIKQNIIGNDAGNFAMAVLPFIKFPTAKYADDNRYEGGIILPVLFKLPGDWTLGSEIEADRLKDSEQNAMHTELLQSLSISHELIKHLEGIGETYYRYDLKKHHWSNFLNASAQLELSENFKIDAGINYGLQSDADKNYFFGTSFRF